MIEVTGRTRSATLIKQLNAANTDFAYVDDPEQRWIIDARLYRRGLGFLRIYQTDRCNVASDYGTALYGHQDTVRTIINRSRTHLVELEELTDLSGLVCS